ncbi:MAG TPA: lipocalin-like domain-containing protein [Tepidisphaeraceae bacterium]|nr:lipocalin-like domain-containing protein [Tepidisphaeraceae bacterium]
MKPLSILLAALLFSQANAPRQWSFPRDHGRHDGFKTEWWYFTGNVTDASGRPFGFQLTFFRSALTPRPIPRGSPWQTNDVYFAHAAISDLANQRFFFKDRLSRGRVGLAYAAADTLDVSLLDWSAKLDGDAIHLQEHEKEFSIDLNCSDGRGPVLEGAGGVNKKGPGTDQASYYYSMTRLKTSGTLTLGDETFNVTGQTWMDHEFSSNALAANQVGWDWMGLNLTDGRDLMIYRLRSSDGKSDYVSGTIIDPDATPHYLTSAQIHLWGDDPWHSPVSGGDYPQRWHVQISGLPPLIVQSRMPGQELNTVDSTPIDYFEGSAEVLDTAGKAAGEGYLEMTGYSRALNGMISGFQAGLVRYQRQTGN